MYSFRSDARSSREQIDSSGSLPGACVACGLAAFPLFNKERNQRGREQKVNCGNEAKTYRCRLGLLLSGW